MGIAQGGVGLLFAVFGSLLIVDTVEYETIFLLPPELLPICVMVLALLSIFSFVSGFYLIRDGWE
jgi:hypothetical protein